MSVTLSAVKRVVLAAYMIADRERQAELAGREYSMDDSQAVVSRCGFTATQLALGVRAEMRQEEAAAVAAVLALQCVPGGEALSCDNMLVQRLERQPEQQLGDDLQRSVRDALKGGAA